MSLINRFGPLVWGLAVFGMIVYTFPIVIPIMLVLVWAAVAYEFVQTDNEHGMAAALPAGFIVGVCLSVLADGTPLGYVGYALTFAPFAILAFNAWIAK